ncbi:MAG: N-acetyltransferase [Pseudomonadaceae bacterium]|nr:N-acetyltransferase [Pseudomonadaceae bacterium]
MDLQNYTNLRTENPADFADIHTLTKLAFSDMPYADGDEQDVIERLRTSGNLALSLVAVINSEIVGHIAFSNASLSDDKTSWFALGPVSVLPDYQRIGVGSMLINAGLEDIRSRGASGCILTGNPEYYQRFGFKFAPDNVPENESELYFMVKTFTAAVPHGIFRFDNAFYDNL